MSMHPFDEALARAPDANGGWSARTHPAYANMNGPYGGITAAQLLGAALDGVDDALEPVSVTVNFCAPIADGPLRLQCRELRAGKTVQHRAVEMTQDGAIVATASVVTALRRDGWSHQPAAMPRVPKPADVPRLPGGHRLAWIDRYEMRFVEGLPVIGATPHAEPAGARSVLWLRDDPPRVLDHCALLAHSDAFFVRIFQVRGTRVPAATVTMTTQFHAGREALARQGEGPLLGVADASVFRRNFYDQQAQLWADDGTLLATSTQTGWFKE